MHDKKLIVKTIRCESSSRISPNKRIGKSGKALTHSLNKSVLVIVIIIKIIIIIIMMMMMIIIIIIIIIVIIIIIIITMKRGSPVHRSENMPEPAPHGYRHIPPQGLDSRTTLTDADTNTRTS